MLVNSYVVYLEGVGKEAVVDTLLPAPVAADGQVEQQVEAFVVWPCLGARALVAEGEGMLLVDI